MILKIAVIVFLFVCSIVHAAKRKHVVCYHGTWATYRPSFGKFDVENIDPFLCTHLIYSFVGIEESGDLRIIDPYLDLEANWGRGNIKKFNALKLKNPTLQTLIAVGGWNEGSKNFSIVASNPSKRARFVKSAVEFVQRHGFDGLDMDWEYPNQRHELTGNDDRSNFVTLLKELRAALKPFGFILTAAVGSSNFLISYNIPEVVKYVDFLNVMAYDLHGAWEERVGINAPLYARANETVADQQLSVNAVVMSWLNEGTPREKLVLGVPFYGRSFTLATIEQHTPGSPHLGRGLAGQYSLEPGFIGYNELCEKMLEDSEWQLEWEPAQMAPYAFRGQQWVGFETQRSISLKVGYAVDNNLAGIMVWSVESDDFLGKCGEKYPLLNQINRVLYGPSESVASSPTANAVTKTTYLNLPSKHIRCTIKSGYIREEKDCSKFYFCDKAGFAHSFHCPKPLQFDVTTSSCNYAELVKCVEQPKNRKNNSRRNTNSLAPRSLESLFQKNPKALSG